MSDKEEDNPSTAKKAIYYIIIEAHDVEDTEFQAEEVNELTERIEQMLSFNGTVYVDDVEYET
jgi:hypothetical protein